MKKIRLGTIHADYLTLAETLHAIENLVEAGQGGFVVTPNVDHVVMAETNADLRAVYEHAALSLADGMPLKWMSSLLGDPLPEKVSGSDLVKPLLQHAAKKEMRVYFMGSAPGVAQQAADKLHEEIDHLQIVGIDSPPFGFDKSPDQEKEIMERMIGTKPDLVLLALGCPKQELLAYRWYQRAAPAVFLCIGASLDFIAGKVKRAPRWMSTVGLEWVYRLSQDPKNLAKRYLMRDLAIFPIFGRMLATSKDERVFFG